MTVKEESIDIEKVRVDTPGVNNRIHFNNAGAALPPQPVVDAVISHIRLEAEIGGYEAEERNHDAIEAVYTQIARLINCHPDEVAFIENATRAWDMAFYSLSLKEGDVILTGYNEYASNYIAFLQRCKRSGAQIRVVPNDSTGQLDVDELSRMVDERVKLIAVTHVATNGGLVNPAAAIGKIARENGVLYLLDACQSVGQMAIDTQELNCDMLSATGRKYLRGPRSTGFLYVRKETARNIEPIFLDLHSAQWSHENAYEVRDDARKFENWEQNFAGKLGLATAVRYLLEIGIEPVQKRVFALAYLLRQGLAEVDGVTVGDIGEVKCGITTFYADQMEAQELVQKLVGRRINTTYTTSFGTRLDMVSRNLPPMVRASVHYYNTEDEISEFLRELKSVLQS